ncbi:hypothetical protein CLV30_12844 [Haloactinopolyspora alba]|uniref:Homeodomain-like domain-containing protein n=1 Tax=Haloactinopolyspora alba TaxID=648780 RepID=A0A2P8DF09_9ACTN|nr:hypothetical protein [Haloactinopolyspora alba]PSK95792.1 hypothetical protein CLV30_12844 [Haloactinopolyspora alba]
MAKRITKARRERMAQVLDLREAGGSYRAIAKQLNISHEQVAQDLSDALTEITREPAERVRDMELDRLDAMLLGLWSRARRGDLGAVDRVIKLMDRRAKYLGLDTPDSSSSTNAVATLLDQLIGDSTSDADPGA